MWSTFFQEKWPELSRFPLHISTKSGGWRVLALNLHSSQGLHETIHWDFFGMNFPVSQHYQKHAVPNLWHQWCPCFLIIGSEPHHDLNNKARPISIDFVPGTSQIVIYYICKTVLLCRCYNSTLVTEEPDTGLLLGFFLGRGGGGLYFLVRLWCQPIRYGTSTQIPALSPSSYHLTPLSNEKRNAHTNKQTYLYILRILTNF